jgi:cobalt-zinc-cadmium efflux system protein
MQSTFLHFLSDTFGSIIAIAVAIIIIYTNWFIVDPILSIIFVSLINFSAIKIIISSFHILMESSPKNIKAQDIKEELEKVASVINIHHIHLWMLNEEENLITLHCLIENNGDITKITKELKEKLVSVFNINHSTIQIELDSSACLN